MAVEPMNPFELNASKRCSQCGVILEEQSECHKSTCDECEGSTFYPLSPLQPPGKVVRFMQGCRIIDDYTN
ncbi:protein YhfH [Paenibacillus xerothermodurans]|uniref:YhfH family protein n=1 Tax=Paenibacillus xerothermodurans TaxID=1977292 RepID=A0A2W1NLU5_PAEXE|nr:protein YhfH [Paenibacillus xerothermodurans]PZE19933.1 YhfH family protein [Paenibacillus xerothermodurans]